MDSLLEQISKPIASDLEDFQNEFYSSLDSDVNIINTIVKYIVKKKGKRFRPRLCLLSAKICGDINKETHITASLLEILHVATLIHDDVVDDSDMRRGWPSVSRVWKNKLSILIGDYLFSKALTNMARTNSIEAVKILADLASRLSQGEILQIEQVVNKTIDEESYFRMISDKTASLFSASCKLGAITSTSDHIKIKALSSFGEHLGLAFQIKDDLFDILGSISDLGKPSGYDLKKNMLTLPLIHIINKKSSIEKKIFKIKIKLLSRTNSFKSIKSIIINEGGIDYTEKKLQEISLLAEKDLEVFDESDSKLALIKSLKFNLERKN
tara:strand:+ start:164 stop:1141 length:978 start_codon:yes stop_codon:yes gene_type:complete